MFEKQELIVSALSIVIGFLAGFIGERYNVCFVSPIKELLIAPRLVLLKIRHELLQFLDNGSYLPTLMGSFGALVAFGLLGIKTPVYNFVSLSSAIMILLGGILLGYLSAKADGCPFKMHIEVGRRRFEALAYLVGFYLGIIYYYLFLAEIISTLIH